MHNSASRPPSDAIADSTQTMTQPSAHARRLPRHWWPIGCLAIGLHAILLFVPGRTPPAPEQTDPLEIRFISPARTEFETVKKPPGKTSTDRTERAPPEAAIASTPAVVRSPERQVETDSSRPVKARTTPNTFQLLEQMRARKPMHEKTSPLILGSDRMSHAKAPGLEPVLPGFVTPFSEVFVASSEEVLDQWMDPSGMVQSVIRRRDGSVICGRADAWDPMNPLFEPIAVYRPCGGGGRRTSRGSPFGFR
mgnify:CR=1 FL=1